MCTKNKMNTASLRFLQNTIAFVTRAENTSFERVDERPTTTVKGLRSEAVIPPLFSVLIKYSVFN